MKIGPGIEPTAAPTRSAQLRGLAAQARIGRTDAMRIGAQPSTTLTYQHALRAFQAGFGTPVVTAEQRHIALRLPVIKDASAVRMPGADAKRVGVVGPSEMTSEPLIGRRGPLRGEGIVFWNGGLVERGSWQPVRTDGTAVILFSNASDAQCEAMQSKLVELSHAHRTMTVETVDQILKFADNLGIHDRYKSTVDQIADTAKFSVAAQWDFPNGASLFRAIKKPVQTRALLVPEGVPLAWNINDASTTNIIGHGALVIVSNELPLELRHIDLADAQTHYRLQKTDEPVRIHPLANANVADLASATSAVAGSASALVRQVGVEHGVAIAAHVGHSRRTVTVEAELDGQLRDVQVGIPAQYKSASQDFYAIEPLALPCPPRWFDYLFGVMRERVRGLPGGAMVTLAAVQGEDLTLAHAGDTEALAFVQDADTGRVTVRSLVPDQSIDNLATLLKAFDHGVQIATREGPAMHIDLPSGAFFAVRERTLRHVNDGMSTPYSVGGYASNETRRKGQIAYPSISQFNIARLRRHPEDRVFLWLSSDGLFDVHPRRDGQPSKNFISQSGYARQLEQLIAQGRESEFAAHAMEHALAQYSTDDKICLVNELPSGHEQNLILGVIDGHSDAASARAIAKAIRAEAHNARNERSMQPAWAHSFDAPKPRAHRVSPYAARRTSNT
ncbi:hypothetical protein LJR230_001450 [Trinickia sp. LjRoot230]|uniref:hypothetical protein n=1 Tax=Trinickia sp. LjRoot230 TaxID=3342288 RepID=UPI003ED0F96D